MAEEPGGLVATDNTVDSAAAAIANLLKGPGTGEQPNPTPEPALEPEPPRLSEPVDEQDSEEAKAPAPEKVTEDPKPVPTPPKADSPDPGLVQRMAEAERAKSEAEAAKSQYLNALNTIVPQLQAQIQGAFPEIKSQEDVLNLMQTNPERYNQFVIAQTRLQVAAQHQQRALAEQQQSQRQQFETMQQEELKKLPTLIPELANPEKAPALAKKIQDYAKAQGYTPMQLAMASANDFKIIYRAMMADEYEAQTAVQQKELEEAKTVAAQKAKGAPPVQKPGNTQPQDNQRNAMRDDFKRLQKSGRVEDAASIFSRMLQ